MNRLTARVRRLARDSQANRPGATLAAPIEPGNSWADIPAEAARLLHIIAVRAKGDADRGPRSNRDGFDVRELLKHATDEELHDLRERLRELPR